jgi:hypothetical protein
MTTQYQVTITSQQHDSLGQRKRAVFTFPKPVSDDVIFKAVADNLCREGLDLISDYALTQIVKL